MVSFSRVGNNKSKRVTAIGALPESKKQRLRSPVATTSRSAESEEDLEFPMTVEDEDGDATFSPVKRQPKRTQTPSAKDEDEEEEEEERAGGGLLNGGERLVRLRAARWRDLNFRGIQLSAKDIRVHWEPKSSTTVTYKRSRNVNGGFVSLSNGEVDIGEIVPFEDSTIDSSSPQSASSSTSLDSSACNTRLRIRCRGVMEATQGNVWRVHKESLLHIFHRSELIVTLRLSVRTSWRPLGALFFVVPPSSAVLHPLPSIPLPITTMSISSPSPSPASSLSSSPLASPPFIASIADMKCVLPPPRPLARSTPNLAPSDTATPGIPIVSSASLPFLLQSDRHNLEVEGYWSFSTVTPASSSPEEEYASNPFEETSISLSASPTSELEFASFVEFQLKSNFIPTATATVTEEQRQLQLEQGAAVHHQPSVEPNALDYFGSLFPEASLPLNLSSS